jgi:hypothetical protein
LTQTRKKIKINLDKERTLHYDLNALVDLEDMLGIPIPELASVKLSIRNIRSFLYAGLKHEDDTLTEQKIGELVSLDNLHVVQEKITEAFSRDTPKN